MRRSIISTLALSASICLAAAPDRDRPRPDPNGVYLQKMCYPNLSNSTRARDLHLSVNGMITSLANSEFPCELQTYIGAACSANGTTEVDFLAEQECFCNGGYWEAIRGCDACNYVHGYRGSPPVPESEYKHSTESYISSLSSAVCSPSPPFQPFSNLLPPLSDRLSSEMTAPPITLTTDLFPNNTAVSNYFTPTESLTPGEITGSATARLTSWTNYSGIRYTPTSTPSTTASGTASASSSSASSTSTNSAVVAARAGDRTKYLVPILLGVVLERL